MANKTKGRFSELAKKYNINAGAANESQFYFNDYIDTGCYMLNAQISGSFFKGLPVGKALLLGGKKSAGKTFIALSIAREAARRYKSTIYWIDTEGTMDPKTMEGLGIDTSQDEYETIIHPADTIEEIVTTVRNVLDSVKGDDPSEIIIIVDSVSMTTTEAENRYVKNGESKRDLSYQRELKKLFKTSINLARFKKVSMIFISHVYDNINGYGNPYKITGGESHQYAASTTLILSRAKLPKDDDPDYDPSLEEDLDNIKDSGLIITSHLDKSRSTKTIDIKLMVSYQTGMNRYYGLKELLREGDIDIPELGVAPGSYRTEKGKRVFNPTKVKGARYWGVKKYQKNISNKKFYNASKYIFTEEALKYLDENRVRPVFEFGSFTDEPITLSDFEDEVDVETEDKKDN